VRETIDARIKSVTDITGCSRPPREDIDRLQKLIANGSVALTNNAGMIQGIKRSRPGIEDNTGSNDEIAIKSPKKASAISDGNLRTKKAARPPTNSITPRSTDKAGKPSFSAAERI
jgi:hypothetical protein